MTTKNINGREVVFVEVEETAKGFWIDKDSLFYKWDKDIIHHSLPDGKFTIIGLASDLSEEQWAGIVESCVITGFDFFYNGFVDYTKTQAGYFKTTESGLSLLSSLGMKPGTTLLLIKEK